MSETNSVPLDPDDPEERDPMAMSRDYHDAPYIIPGLRIRRVSPSTRRHPRRHLDQVVGPVLGDASERLITRDVLKPSNGVQIDAKFVGVLRQADPLGGVLRQNVPPSEGADGGIELPPKIATPPEGAERPLEGGGESGRPNTRTSPLRQNLNGSSMPFWRSDDADPGAGVR
jgi:hypothetical protein